MSDISIRVGEFSEFKRIIGLNMKKELQVGDVKVASVTGEPFEKTVSAPDRKDFISKMLTFCKENAISSSTVAIVTSENLIKEEMSDSPVSNVQETPKTSTKFKR